MNPNRTRNLTLEWVKLLAACFVVLIHVLLPGDLGSAADCIGRFAVPVFFAISGYYAFGAESRSVAKKLLRTLRLTVGANLFYFFLSFFLWNYEEYIHFVDYFHYRINLYNLSNMFITGVTPTEGWQLWFLTALLFCYAVLYLYVRFFNGEPVKYSYLYCISACMLAFFFYQDSLMDLQGVTEINETARNGLFLGLPCFSLGLFLREHEERIARAYPWSNLRSLILIADGIGLSLVQYFGTGKAELPLGMLLAVPELFLFCVHNPIPRLLPFRTLAPWAGKMSLWVFLLHMAVYLTIMPLQNSFPVLAWICSEEGPIPLGIWVLLLTLAVSQVVVMISPLFGKLIRRRSKTTD